MTLNGPYLAIFGRIWPYLALFLEVYGPYLALFGPTWLYAWPTLPWPTLYLADPTLADPVPGRIRTLYLAVSGPCIRPWYPVYSHIRPWYPVYSHIRTLVHDPMTLTSDPGT